VPTAWNGQLIALYALNALFAACVVAAGYGWTRSARGALAAGAAVACLGAAHPAAFSSDWMPYACVADPGWAFLMSSQSICSPAQARGGFPLTVYPDDLIPRGADPLARLQRAIVTSGTKRT
jgi:hypothetical protein